MCRQTWVLDFKGKRGIGFCRCVFWLKALFFLKFPHSEVNQNSTLGFWHVLDAFAWPNLPKIASTFAALAYNKISLWIVDNHGLKVELFQGWFESHFKFDPLEGWILSHSLAYLWGTQEVLITNYNSSSHSCEASFFILQFWHHSSSTNLPHKCFS